ncbi:unnamed protein product, partial [marine sediment metagenome]
SSYFIGIIIVVVIVIAGLLVYFIYLKPMLEAKRTLKLVETAVSGKSTRPT